MENRVVFDAVDKTIKSLWFNTKFMAKVFRVMNSPVIQKMELGRFRYRRRRVENMSG